MMGEGNKERSSVLQVGSKNLNTENWKVYHPSGRHMFTCGEKKAFWYMDRGLALVTGKNKIKFTFYPKGNGFEDSEIFGRSIRENKCVVTGIETGLQRHHIVPYCYRTYFPEEFKSKNHHDVVLINYEKHSEYEQLANHFKDEVAHMYGVKTINEYNTEYTIRLRDTGKSNAILLNTIHSFFKCYKSMPYDIKMEKLRFIADETGMDYDFVRNLTYIQLYKMFLMLREKHSNELDLFKAEYRETYDHGFHVVQKLDTEEKIEEFVKLWRNHFIDTMNPLFMPTGWSIDFRIKTKI